MTPVQVDIIRRFRSRHRIEPIRDYELDYVTTVCKVDGLRVYRLRNGTYRHDVSDVRRWEGIG